MAVKLDVLRRWLKGFGGNQNGNFIFQFDSVEYLRVNKITHLKVINLLFLTP